MLQLYVILRDRKLNRLSGHDYSWEGWYFVTIDCMKMYSWFGKINAGNWHCPSRTIMKLNNYGLVAEKYWKSIPKIYNNLVLDEFVIMPNHMHGIIQIVGTGQCPVRTRNGIWQCPVRTKDKVWQCPVHADSNNHNRYGKLSKIINGYKNMVTKEIRNNFGGKSFVWQRSFYDEIIRDEKSLDRIRKYIIGNPENFLKSK